MGSAYHFRCQRCGYHAEVSGGDDIGFVVKTRTAYCPTCRELRDISVEYWSAHPMTPADRDQPSDDDLGRCFACGNRDVVDWSLCRDAASRPALAGGNDCESPSRRHIRWTSHCTSTIHRTWTSAPSWRR